MSNSSFWRHIKLLWHKTAKTEQNLRVLPTFSADIAFTTCACKMKLMSIPANKVVYIAFTAFFLLGAYNMAQTTVEILKSSKRLDTLQSEVQGLQTQKDELEQSIDYKKSQDYIEERARNALNLVKPGEKVYVATSQPKHATTTETINQPAPESKKQEPNNNLQQWLNFLF